MVYSQKIKQLSKQYLELQNDLSVLADLSWKPSTKSKFETLKFEKLPELTHEDFHSIPYDPIQKVEEFQKFINKVKSTLGPNDIVGHMLIRNSNAWIKAIDLVQSRNTSEVYEKSKKLYGSSEDKVFGVKLIDIALKLDKLLANLETVQGGPEEKTVTSKEMVSELKERLEKYFGKEVNVSESDNMGSDANASLGGINIRKGALFRPKDIGVFEVHEGWVHLASSMNGLSQPYIEFLREPCPGTEIIQEGLGALTEVVTLKSYPTRARKIVERVIAINMAENGASFLDVYHWYLTRRNNDLKSAYVDTTRVFHGGLLEGGAPLTRDIIYLKGFLFIVKFLVLCFQNKRLSLIPFLFEGNIYLEDIPSLYLLAKKGIVKYPKYVPSIFREDGIERLVIFLNQFSFVKDKLIH